MREHSQAIEPHLTPPAIAEALGIAPETVLGWIKSGQLVARRLGKGTQRPRYRVAQSALERFLQSRETTPPAARQRKRREAKPIKSWCDMMNLEGGR